MRYCPGIDLGQSLAKYDRKGVAVRPPHSAGGLCLLNQNICFQARALIVSRCTMRILSPQRRSNPPNSQPVPSAAASSVHFSPYKYSSRALPPPTAPAQRTGRPDTQPCRPHVFSSSRSRESLVSLMHDGAENQRHVGQCKPSDQLFPSGCLARRRFQGPVMAVVSASNPTPFSIAPFVRSRAVTNDDRSLL